MYVLPLLIPVARYVLIQIWSFCVGRKTSTGGFFAYVCTDRLAFVDYMRTAPKNPLIQDWSLFVDTQKAISYLDHFCARKVGVFAFIRNLDLKMKITCLMICAHSSQCLSRNAGNFA